jgi:hemolysin III
MQSEQRADEREHMTDAYGHRPYWRGKIHLIAAFVAAPAALVLLVTRSSVGAKVAAAVFGASLVGLFSVSATYHLRARTERAVLWFRRLDHSMIFILIAGTYTPICVLALPPAWGIPLLVVVWTIALGGITIKMLRMTDRAGANASWLYIVMGWAALFTMPALIRSLDTAQLSLIAVGGVLYTLGAVGLWRRWPDPAPNTFGYHEVWHSMTIAAATCHFVAVALIA